MTAVDVRRYAAEFLGTYLLVFAGPGAVVIDAVSNGGVTSVGIGMSFGLAVMAIIFALGHVSGAHINPAVTLAFCVTRHFRWSLAPGYIISQLAGAATAGLTLRLLFGNVANLGATIPRGSAWQALGLELVLSFFLMFIIVSVATDVRAVGQAAAVAVGGYVGLAATFAGPIAGASMNPARSFGPAIASGLWTAHWVYWVGPVVGAVLGGIAYIAIRGNACPPPQDWEVKDRDAQGALVQ